MCDFHMPRENAVRLLKDVRSIYKENLHDQGIYYHHDEENMTKGYALIIGSENTPYQYGNYLFTLDFPTSYPYSPPTLTFENKYDNIRFHPNLYRNGKVCISILNTWTGEKWSACQTIKSVLLTICTILTENPLLHEPGITTKHEDYNKYNTIISYTNVKYNILEIINDIENRGNFKNFKDVIIKKFIENYDTSIKKFIENYDNNPTCVWIQTRLYNMTIKIDYAELIRNYKKTYTQYYSPITPAEKNDAEIKIIKYR